MTKVKQYLPIQVSIKLYARSSLGSVRRQIKMVLVTYSVLPLGVIYCKSLKLQVITRYNFNKHIKKPHTCWCQYGFHIIWMVNVQKTNKGAKPQWKSKWILLSKFHKPLQVCPILFKLKDRNTRSNQSCSPFCYSFI